MCLYFAFKTVILLEGYFLFADLVVGISDRLKNFMCDIMLVLMLYFLCFVLWFV